ncbi:MAG: transcription initiation factor IIB [Ignisphaera sp.]|nr:transcription initiation factor IIB [Ignisphaera sp.]MCX8168085.1 transcription initiation factor IIB [Ignisphaera sp.]MDW8085909.1 transcription initiation factor IIB [Ignisphaera sp.]
MVIRPSEPSPEDVLTRCPSGNIIYDEVRGEWICADSGEVVAEHVIDRGPEWRAFTAEEKEQRSRAGGPINIALHDSGLSTVIDWYDRDASGRRLDLKRRLEIIRIRKWHSRTRVQSNVDRNIMQALNELDRIANQLGMPRVVREEAAIIYRRAVERELVRGRAIESMVAAALYAACRIHGVPRTLDEISKFTKSGRKEVARCYRLLVRELTLKIPIVDAAEHAQRIAFMLGLSGATVKTAIEIIQKAREMGVTAGRDPAGVAAAAVYIAALLNDERRTQKEVAMAAGVTEVTVRNRYKELMKALGTEEQTEK